MVVETTRFGSITVAEEDIINHLCVHTEGNTQ